MYKNIIHRQIQNHTTSIGIYNISNKLIIMILLFLYHVNNLKKKSRYTFFENSKISLKFASNIL